MAKGCWDCPVCGAPGAGISLFHKCPGKKTHTKKGPAMGPIGPPPNVGSAISPAPCEHNYSFLRQEERSSTETLYNVVVEDVFFCSRCCQYKRVPILEKAPSRDKFGWDVVKRY